MWAGVEGNDILARMPNGVNWYRGKRKSDFVELTLPYLDEEKDRLELLSRLNREFAGSTNQRPVYSLIRRDDKLVPVAENAYPFAVLIESNRWKKFIQQNYSLPNEDGKYSLNPPVISITPVVSPFFEGEPNIAILAMPWLQSIIEAEYVAKVGYMEACLNNQWLIPYANRLGWRFVNDSASVIVPYWSNEDLLAWQRVTPQKASTKGFRMSDGKRYPYPEDIEIQLPDVQTTNKDVFVVDGYSFNVSYALENVYPQTNRKQRSVARIADAIRDDMVPFDPPYPVVNLNDAEIRIQSREFSGLTIVYLVPNNIIFGMYPIGESKNVLEEYRKLWNQGELLNDYGHYHYRDSYSELDERGIIQSITI